MQLIVLDVDTADVVVSSRDTEFLDVPEPGVPGSWSAPIPFATFATNAAADQGLYLVVLAAVLSLFPNEPWNNATSVVIGFNVAENGIAIRTVEYKVSRVILKADDGDWNSWSRKMRAVVDAPERMALDALKAAP